MLPKAFTGPCRDGAPVWPEADWWKGFHDDELASLIGEAQAGNRDLAVAAAHVMEAQAQSTIARAALFPQVDGGARARQCRLQWPGLPELRQPEGFQPDVQCQL